MYLHCACTNAQFNNVSSCVLAYKVVKHAQAHSPTPPTSCWSLNANSLASLSFRPPIGRSLRENFFPPGFTTRTCKEEQGDTTSCRNNTNGRADLTFKHHSNGEGSPYAQHIAVNCVCMIFAHHKETMFPWRLTYSLLNN